jgi:hypothetical protein
MPGVHKKNQRTARDATSFFFLPIGRPPLIFGVGRIEMTDSPITCRLRLPFLLGAIASVVSLPFTWAYVVDLHVSGRADDVGI